MNPVSPKDNQTLSTVEPVKQLNEEGVSQKTRNVASQSLSASGANESGKIGRISKAASSFAEAIMKIINALLQIFRKNEKSSKVADKLEALGGDIINEANKMREQVKAAEALSSPQPPDDPKEVVSIPEVANIAEKVTSEPKVTVLQAEISSPLKNAEPVAYQIKQSAEEQVILEEGPPEFAKNIEKETNLNELISVKGGKIVTDSREPTVADKEKYKFFIVLKKNDDGEVSYYYRSYYRNQYGNAYYTTLLPNLETIKKSLDEIISVEDVLVNKEAILVDSDSLMKIFTTQEKVGKITSNTTFLIEESNDYYIVDKNNSTKKYRKEKLLILPEADVEKYNEKLGVALEAHKSGGILVEKQHIFMNDSNFNLNETFINNKFKFVLYPSDEGSGKYRMKISSDP